MYAEGCYYNMDMMQNVPICVFRHCSDLLCLRSE